MTERRKPKPGIVPVPVSWASDTEIVPSAPGGNGPTLKNDKVPQSDRETLLLKISEQFAADQERPRAAPPAKTRAAEAHRAEKTVVVPLSELARQARDPDEWRPKRPLTTVAKANQVIVLFSCKGGCGSTLLSVNIAHALQRFGRPACVLDMDLQLGDVLASLGLSRKLSIAQALDGLERGEGISAATLSTHESGLRVLSQVGAVDDLDKISADKLPLLIADLRRRFDTIIIDGVRDFSDSSLALLDLADKILLVTVQEVLAVRRARWVTRILKRIGWSSEAFELLVNRFDEQSSISLSSVRELFVPTVVTSVPADMALAREVLERGLPLHAVGRQRPLTMKVDSIAAVLMGKTVHGVSELTEQPSLWSRLTGWRQR